MLIPSFFKKLKQICMIWTLFEINAVLLTDVCDVVTHTDFQLQLRGPFDPKAKYFLHSINLFRCSNICCKNETCDVALFVNKTCVLIHCPTNLSCQPYISTNSIDPLVLGKNSSLSYVQKRQSSQNELVSSDIFNSLLPPVTSLNNSKLNNVTNHQDDNKIDDSVFNGTVQNNLTVDKDSLKSTTLSSVVKESSTAPSLTINSTYTFNDNDPTAQRRLNITTTVSSPTTTSTKSLHVTITGKTKIRLPNDSIVLHAEVDEKTLNGNEFKWILIGHPTDFHGEETVNGNSLTLESLKAGKYQYKVEVTNTNAFGEAYVNITVDKPFRLNTPPVALIVPTHQEITLPNNNAVLDGQTSHDDDKIVSYLWKMVGKPLEAPEILWTDNTQKMLELKNLVAGDYEFRLIVTDSDSVRNSTTATLTVNKKIDLKPHADAGLNQVVHLPQNSVTLYANNSVDDYGIISYKWALSPDSPNDVVDLQGARTSELHLSNFESGRYIIRLTVTDASEQEDTATVTVTVLPESNHPPVANAGQDKQVFLPLDGSDTTANLDGSQSTDDKGIKTVLWEQKSGPSTSKITNPNSITTSVSGLNTAGNYVFLLTVRDKEDKSSNDEVSIIVSEIEPPVSDAGSDQIIQLPNDVIVLDGSKSHDDYGIKSFHWSRDSSSVASGRIVNGSDETSRLIVSGVTEGSYQFTLTVTNIRGKQASDQVTVLVQGDPRIKNLVELHLSISPNAFTESMKNIIAKQISLLLSLNENEEVLIETVYSEHRTGHLVILFYIQLSDDEFMPAINVMTTLNDKLQSDVHLFDVDVVLVDTFVCENNCSGHGTCHSGSKLCQCDRFWMQNFFRVYLGDGANNCDWSILYVVIVSFILIVATLAITYTVYRLCKRGGSAKLSRSKRRKKHYQPIENELEKVPLKNVKNGIIKNGFRKHTSSYRSSSLMRSMTSSSDEDETLYEKQRLIKNNRKTRTKKREKLNPAPLLDLNEEPESEAEFDGSGLDKTAPATLHNMRSSDEFV